MFKFKIFISIAVFSLLIILTSIIKTQTRILEKKIYKSKIILANIEKDLHETQLDYSYLTSPSYLSKKIDNLSYFQYSPMDFSRIFLSYDDFLNNQKKKSRYLKLIMKRKK